jgi:hypothetical protein
MDKINQTGSVKLTKDDLKYYADYTMTKEVKKRKRFVINSTLGGELNVEL